MRAVINAKVQVIKTDQVLRKYCDVFTWAIFDARIEVWVRGRFKPTIETGVWVKNKKAPYGETRLKLSEIKIIALNHDN